MILVDSSVWIDHLRATDEMLVALLSNGEVLVHPFVVGELALGSICCRESVLGELRKLPTAFVAADVEVMHLIDRHRLYGLGVGYIDAHLLASAQLSANTAFWTRDRRLADVASRLGLALHLPH